MCTLDAFALFFFSSPRSGLFFFIPLEGMSSFSPPEREATPSLPPFLAFRRSPSLESGYEGYPFPIRLLETFRAALPIDNDLFFSRVLVKFLFTARRKRFSSSSMLRTFFASSSLIPDSAAYMLNCIGLFPFLFPFPLSCVRTTGHERLTAPFSPAFCVDGKLKLFPRDPPHTRA